MAWRLIALAALVVVWTGLDLALHVALLAPLYRHDAASWRPLADIRPAAVFGVRIALAASLLALYDGFVTTKSPRSGLAFGAVAGVMLGVAVGAGTYLHMPISGAIAWSWFVAAVVKTAVAGVLLGTMLGPRTPHTAREHG